MSVARSPGICGWLLVLPAALLLSARVLATNAGAPAPLSDIALPGGLAAARDVIGDRVAPDRALFLAELIERYYNAPAEASGKTSPAIRALLERLTHPAPQVAEANPPADTVPLPLSPGWWVDAVFEGKARPETLAAAIIGSHDAALLYWSLLALDTPTREWLADRRGIVRALARGDAPRFVIVAPFFRVENGQVNVPGGERAREAWEAFTGASPADPDAFLRALLDDDTGRRANFYRSLATLSNGQLSSVLRLQNADRTAVVEAMERLFSLFERAESNWNIVTRPFFRQPIDPSNLIAEIRVDEDMRPALPGGEAFWSAVFEGRPEPTSRAAGRGGRPRNRDTGGAGGQDVARVGEPLDLVWLLERVYGGGDTTRTRARTEQVLFAARVFGGRNLPNADVSVAVAAFSRYPALFRALERLHVTDAAVYRRAVERASSLDAVADRSARARSLAQFQSALALLVHAAAHGSVAWDDVPALVSTLSDVETGKGGDYEGRLARWIDALRSKAHERAAEEAAGTDDPGADVAADLIRLVAGPPASARAEIVWEGTRYRVDPAAATTTRLERVRGDQPRPFLQSAWTLFSMADRIDTDGGASIDLAREAEAFDRVLRDMGWGTEAAEASSDPSLEYDEIGRALQTTPGSGVRSLAGVAARLRVLGDDLAARGLMELVYAAALGDPGASSITSEEAANRHRFGEGRGVPSAPWRLPGQPGTPDGAWRLEGSVLGLDMCLAERWLTRVSSKPLSQPPSVQRSDREALVEAVVLLNAASLSDEVRDAIAAAVRAGRARVAAATAADLDALADAIPLDPVRRSLLPWVFVHTPDRLVPFFSTAELVSLGLPGHDERMNAWGAPAWPRSGCPCLQLPYRLPRYVGAGYPDSGRLASIFPDLTLRLAELLADLNMPAALVPGIAAAATSDLVDRAPSRYAGDLRGIVEHVQSLTTDDLERYLALLTTGGPLVLVRESDTAATGSAP